MQDYEREALILLCADVLPASVLHAVINKPIDVVCKFTGAGYYLELHHNDIPAGRIVCSEPRVIGRYQERDVGFVVFIEHGVMTLECHDYDSHGIPEEIRHGTVKVSAT